jgi:putative transposase
MRQEIVERAKTSVRSLRKLKKSGHKVGSLKFKSQVKSIPLRQYLKTHKICGDKITIQNIKQPMRLRGLDQIPEGVEMANATLDRKDGNYYVHLTTYQNQVPRTIPKGAIGIDSGIKHQLTLSNGLRIDERVSLTKKLKRLQRRLSGMKTRSGNWFETKLNLSKEHNHIANQRKDIRNKIVGKLAATYECVATQDDYFPLWQKMWGRRIAESAIGGITSGLKQKPHTSIVVQRYAPTTKKCSNCGILNNVELETRVFCCNSCRLHIDRDLNAAINIWRAIPAERREITPVDMRTATELLGYFNRIPGVAASLVKETGSQPPATETN